MSNHTGTFVPLTHAYLDVDELAMRDRRREGRDGGWRSHVWYYPIIGAGLVVVAVVLWMGACGLVEV